MMKNYLRFFSRVKFCFQCFYKNTFSFILFLIIQGIDYINYLNYRDYKIGAGLYGIPFVSFPN